MALANVLGYRSNDDFDRSLKSKKTSDEIDELCPTLNVENIGQFISLPPYADVRRNKKETIIFSFVRLAGKISSNGQ